MSETALARTNYMCLNCGAPVPSPLTLCFSCGGTPLIGDPSGEWSVTVDPVPSAKMRRDVAAWLSSLFPGLDPTTVEAALTEGRDPLWVTSGLSKATADSLVQRLREMHVPAKAHLGSPAGANRDRRWLPALAVGGLAAVVAIWWTWFAVVLGILAVGLVVLRGRSTQSVPLGLPEQKSHQDKELTGHVRAMIEAAKSAPADVAGSLRSINNQAGSLFALLADEQNSIGYIAGGIEGRIGVATKGLVGTAASLAAALRQGEASSDVARRLAAVDQTLSSVNADLRALALSPDDEPDLAGRLESNAQKLETAGLR